MNTLSGNGLTIGQSLTPNYAMKIRQGDGGSPYTAPPKEDPNRRYVPAPKRELANLADGEPDASMMYYPTANGFFLDGQGNAYMQTGGKFYDAGEYNIDIHGLPVPLARQMQINPDVAMDYDPGDTGGVVIPQDFSPLPFRYFQHYRTPEIRQQELDHFNNFIESMGGGLDKVQNPNAMTIAQAGVGAPHSNVKIYEDTDYYGNPYKRVLPNFGGTYIGNVRPKKT